jgi:hypothetical protein
VKLRHLVGRFLGSLWPAGPRPADEAWARGHLTPREVEVWERMGRVDRRHAVAVAGRVERALGHEASRPVLAAALLHDCGKIQARLGVYGRVIATLAGTVAGPHYPRLWSKGRGFTRRVGLYLRHAELGGDVLAMAASDPLTVAWTREHHRPPDDWSVPAHIGAALKAADDD